MPEAILYCDHCTRMISAADVKSGEAVITPGGAFCAACVQALEPEQREALRKLAAGKPADTSLSSVFQRPKPLASRRPPTAKTILPAAARRKRSQTTMLRAARAEPQTKSRAGAMVLAGLGLGLLVGLLALMLRAPKPSRNRKPPKKTTRPPAAGRSGQAGGETRVFRSPIFGGPIRSKGGVPFQRPGLGRQADPTTARNGLAHQVFKQGDVWRYFKGTIFPGAGWNGLGFDDSSWLSGPTGIGYGDNDDATVLSDMPNTYLTVYMRREFTMGDAAAAKSLSFSVDYDDGFVAFMNGDEVARRGVAVGQDRNTRGRDHDAGTPEMIDLTPHRDSLVDGTNVFAIELHNRILSSSDASMIPELTIRGGDPVGTSAGVGPAVVAPDIERGLVAHWTFDETDGATATDASGNALAGSLRNMDQARSRVAGRVGGALSFDGVDDYVLCGNDPKFSKFKRFTLAAWVRPDDTSTSLQFGDPIIAKEGTGRGYQLTWHHDGRFGFMLAGTQMTWSRQDKTNGTWYHVAAVFGKGTAYIYVDGVMEANTAPGYQWNTTDPLHIGAHQGNTRHLKATIDDVRIYNRALTAEEIRALVDTGPFAPTVTSTVRSNAYVGHRYSYTIRASGNLPPAFSVSGLPKWLFFDGKDTFSGAPERGDIGVTGTITVTAENAQGSDTQEFTIKVGKFTLASSLLAHWRLDETSDTTAADSSGNGYTGTLTNMAGTEWTTGRIGGALSFIDADDIVLVSGYVYLGADWTIATWFTTPLPATGAWHTLSRAEGDGNDHQVILDSSLNLGTYDNATGWGFRSCGYSMAGLSNGWHHLAAVGTGTTTAFYVDGSHVGTSDRKSAGSVYSIGNYQSAEQRFSDTLDDVRIYECALTAQEVAELYRSTGGETREIAATRESPEGAEAGAAPAEETPPAAQGLLGEYYGNIALTGEAALTRIDLQIDFDWGTRSPDPKLPEDRFSVRWTGTIRPEYSETYTFHVYRNDGVKLCIAEDLIIDRWRMGSGEISAMKTLEAGVNYSIRIEYYDGKGPARVSLEWQSDSQPRELVPPSALSPPAGRSEETPSP